MPVKTTILNIEEYPYGTIEDMEKLSNIINLDTVEYTLSAIHKVKDILIYVTWLYDCNTMDDLECSCITLEDAETLGTISEGLAIVYQNDKIEDIISISEKSMSQSGCMAGFTWEDFLMQTVEKLKGN